MPKTKLKKIKAGKIKRHKFRKKLGLKSGFGRPWQAPSITFRVEFAWVDSEEEESNEQVHWIQCRKFVGEEYQFLKAHYGQSTEDWSERETIESKFVCVYVARFLVENKDKLHLNQAFIFPTPKRGNQTIRLPIYQVKWTENLARNCTHEENIAVVMKNSIWHQY